MILLGGTCAFSRSGNYVIDPSTTGAKGRRRPHAPVGAALAIAKVDGKVLSPTVTAERSTVAENCLGFISAMAR